METPVLRVFMWSANWQQAEDLVLEELKISELLDPSYSCYRLGKWQTQSKTNFFFYNQRSPHKQYMMDSVDGGRWERIVKKQTDNPCLSIQAISKP